MVGIGGIVVIVGVATRTGVGCVVIVAVVTLGAIIGDTGMSPVQRVVAVVVRKRGRFPGCIGMAGGTIGGNIEGNVVRIGCLVIIICMAPRAGIGCIHVIAVVT